MSTPIPSLGNKTPEQLKVAELREELRKRGINSKGIKLKKDLVERLEEALREEAAEEEDVSKKSSPEEASDGGEEASPPPRDVIEDDAEPAGVDGADKGSELKADLVDPGLDESLPEEEPKPDKGTEGQINSPEEEPLPVKGTEDQTKGPEEEFETGKGMEVQTNEPEIPSEEKGMEVQADASELPSEEKVVLVEPVVLDAIPESNAAADSRPSPKPQENSGLDIQAPEGRDEPMLIESEPKAATEDVEDEKTDLGKSVEAEDKIMDENTEEEKMVVEKLPEAEAEVHPGQIKEPVRYSGPTSSTDAVIIEASEPEDIPTENTYVSEGLDRVPYSDRDAEEEEGSVVEETGAEQIETITAETVTIETVSVVTETTTFTVENVAVNGIEAEPSTVEAEQEEGSFTHRTSDAGTYSTADKEKEKGDAFDERHSDKDGMDIEEEEKAKDSKPMEIDSDSLSGVKRKDGDDPRHQEPTKRQRRWNSDKSVASAEVKSLPKVTTADTFKEVVPAEIRESVQAPIARSPSTTASSTPKATASASFEKLTPSRPALSRTDIAVNGEVDKKRQVPPALRAPTISLKIDRFVRPFTIKAVRELLEQTGMVKEMWMDQIKTHCYVTYSSVGEAVATRNALYNLQWPVAGGKLLVAEFVEPEEVKLRVDGVTDKTSATPVTTPRGSANSTTQVTAPVGLTPPAVPLPTTALPPPPPLPPPPRERPALLPKKEQEPPIPTLDDLFKKTRTKPQIYYLPLAEEQVATKLRNKAAVNKAPVKA